MPSGRAGFFKNAIKPGSEVAETDTMNTNLASLPGWVVRLVQRQPQAAPSSLMHSRIEVCPPQVWPSSLTWRGRLQRLIETSPWLPQSRRPINRLAVAREDFLFHLSDILRSDAQALAERIRRARSLRELWHLRLPLYGTVSVALSEGEAERRLAHLNRHFPVRAPRAPSLAPDA